MIMTATINQIISNVLAALIIIIMAIAFTSVYWCLKFDHELKIQKRLKKQLEALHLDRMKDRVALEKQAKTLKSKLDFYYHVLYEVHQEKWNMVYSQFDERTLLLREMVDSTLKLMSYEDMKEVERADHVLVNRFCQDVFDNCHQYLKGEVDVRMETELDDEETICTNMKCLQTVLTNMLLCAMQFTHEGEIVLEVKRRCQKKKQYLKFAVKDTGIGIPEDVKDVVFDKITGTNIDTKIIGVRLRLCKAITKLLDGSIYLDPSHENGTSVVLLIKI